MNSPAGPSLRVRLLLELARDVTGAPNLQSVLDHGLTALRRMVAFEGGSIQLVENGALRIAAGIPAPTREALSFRLPLGTGLGGWVFSSGLPLYSRDVTADVRASPGGLARAAVAGIRSYFGAPLIIGGQTIGLVQIDATTVDAFSEDDQFSVVSFIPAIAAGVQNALLTMPSVEVKIDLNEILSGR